MSGIRCQTWQSRPSTTLPPVFSLISKDNHPPSATNKARFLSHTPGLCSRGCRHLDWGRSPVVSTFRSLTQLPSIRSKATSSRKRSILYHSITFPCSHIADVLPHHLAGASTGKAQVTINLQLPTWPKGLDITDSQ